MALRNFDLHKFCLVMANYLNSTSNITQLISDASFTLKIKKQDVSLINEKYFPHGMKSYMLIIVNIVNESLRKKKSKDFSKLRVNEKIKHLIFLRLKILNEIFDKKKLFFFISNPSNFFLSLEILFKISDEIWWLAGDKSTDMNFYSKRIILMNILSNSFTLFAFDNSQEHNKTQKFIENQIKMVLRFGKVKKSLENFISI